MKTLLSLWKRFWSLQPRRRIELTLLAMVAVFVFRWSVFPVLHLGINNLMWTGKVFAAESELQFGGKLPEYDIDLPFPTVIEALQPPPPDQDWSQWKLTDDQLVIALNAAGFDPSTHKMAIAVIRAESGGRPYAFNGNKYTQDRSYGLMQINLHGYLGRDRMKRYNLKSEEELYDPVLNLKIAHDMSRGGKSWKHWSGYKNGSYKKYL